MRNSVIILAGTLLLALMVTAFAEAPPMINYQGRLTDAAGDPVADGDYEITFTIYDDSTGDISIWEEVHSAVPVRDGLFDVILGLSEPIGDTLVADSFPYLAIRIGADPEIAPRTRLTSVPYALHASSVPGFNPGPNNIDSGLYTFVAGDNNTVLDDYCAVLGGSGNRVEVLSITDTTFDTTGLFVPLALTPGFSLAARLPANPCRSIHLPAPSYAIGLDNLVGGDGAIVLGGQKNTAKAGAGHSAIYGGASNWTETDFSVVTGGYCNQTLSPGYAQTISGGVRNRSLGHYTFVGGGYQNIISAEAYACVVGGGFKNETNNHVATLAGGYCNRAEGVASTISGGAFNRAEADYSTVAGGGWTSVGNPSTGNFVYDEYGTIGGGGGNTAGDNATGPTGEPGGTVAGGHYNHATGKYTSVGGGYDNTAIGEYATVGGGGFNVVQGVTGTIAGGDSNQVTYSAEYSFIGGGRNHYVDDQFAAVVAGDRHQIYSGGAYGFIGSGRAHIIEDQYATVVGGDTNHVYAGGQYGFIGGGQMHEVYNQFGTIAGGDFNVIAGDYGTIGGGSHNSVEGEYGTVAGGGWVTPGFPATANFVHDNYGTVGGGGGNSAGDNTTPTIDEIAATVAGGQHNRAAAVYSSVGGGLGNQAEGQLSTVGGGMNNWSLTLAATIGGGDSNYVVDDYGTVGGGQANTAGDNASGPTFETYATVAGGSHNQARGNGAAVGGGVDNEARGSGTTVAGGMDNEASWGLSSVGGGSVNRATGQWATIPGGLMNLSQGNYSFAAGRQAQAMHNNTFVWNDYSAGSFASTGVNQFLVHADNGVGVNLPDPTEDLDVRNTARLRNMPTTNILDPVHADLNGVLHRWIPVSSRRYKDDIRDLGIGSDAILNLEPVRFNWKENGVEDIGLIAEDVEKVIPEMVIYNDQGQVNGVKYDKLSIYLLAAARDLKTDNDELRAELARVQTTMNALVKQVQQLAAATDPKKIGDDKLAGN